MDRKANFLGLCLLDSLEDENMSAFELLINKYNANASLIIADRGIAAIHYACGMQNAEMAEKVVDLMLSKMANPNVRSEENMTPLHVAAIWGRSNIFKTLLKHGAEIDAIDDDKKTPILYAIYEKQFEIVKIFQNHIFEKKYEERRKSIMMGVNKINTPQIVQNLNLLTAKNLQDKKFTPNRINYNFDVTSPYYINITHRRTKRSDDDNKGDDDEIPSTLSLVQNERQENLFKLTEENVNELSKNSTAVGKSKNSYINIWREKVARSKNRTSILRSFTDIDALLNGITSNDNLNFTNVSLNMDGTNVPKKPLRKKFSNTSFGKLLERLKNPNKSLTENYSFVTAEEGEASKCETASNVTIDDNTNPNTNCNNSNEMNLKSCNKSTTFIRTPKDDDFIMQMTEEYVHTDDENGLVWYEKKFLAANPVNERNKDLETSKMNKTISTISTGFTVPENYDTDELRAELTIFGEPPGPITKSTKRLYTKRLMKYKRNRIKVDAINEIGRSNPNFSIELDRTFQKIEWFNRIPEYLELESKMSCQFQGSSGQQNKKWREGHLKTSFIYLLIDPRKSNNLPGESTSMKHHEVWQTFLMSIFYVGKGKSSRPYSHLYDAMKTFSKNYLQNNLRSHREGALKPINNMDNNHAENIVSGKSSVCLVKSTRKKLPDSKKLERILDIWQSEMGVVCLHVFHNILPAEAYTREAAIIDCLGLQHLTNLKRGDYYGPAQSWTMRMRKQLGIALLFKSMQIFLAEGESQLMPSDLI